MAEVAHCLSLDYGGSGLIDRTGERVAGSRFDVKGNPGKFR